MQTTFTTKDGTLLTPEYFAVYFRVDGTSFRKIQDEISMYDFSTYENIKRIELYKNGTSTEPAQQIDRLDN